MGQMSSLNPLADVLCVSLILLVPMKDTENMHNLCPKSAYSLLGETGKQAVTDLGSHDGRIQRVL